MRAQVLEKNQENPVPNRLHRMGSHREWVKLNPYSVTLSSLSIANYVNHSRLRILHASPGGVEKSGKF